jgi:H+/gluconate symporter-like permease
MLVLFVTVALVLQIVLGSAPVALAINVAFLAGYLTTRGWDLLVHWRGFQ